MPVVQNTIVAKLLYYSVAYPSSGTALAVPNANFIVVDPALAVGWHLLRNFSLTIRVKTLFASALIFS